MVERNAVGDYGLGDDGVGEVCWCGVFDGGGWCWKLGVGVVGNGLGEVKIPEAGVGGAGAAENCGSVEGDGDGVGGEGGYASVIAEGADRYEGAGC